MKDLTKVNGVKVEARERARYTEDNKPNPMVPVGTEVPTVDELLLADGTVMFQCVHPRAEDCEYVNANLRSVTAHQTAHGVRVERRVAREAAERAAAAEAELAERRQRQVNGGKKAAETRRANRMSTPTEIGGRGGPKTGTNPASSAIGDGELALMAQRVVTAYNAMQDAHDEFQKVMLGYIRAAQTATENVKPDPQIVAKAHQYDVLMAALKGVNAS